MEMIRLLFRIIAYGFRLMIRNLYWLYRLSRIGNIHQVRIFFPVIVEGRGKISFGAGSVLNSHANLGCATGSHLSFGRNCGLGNRVFIRIGGEARIHFGDQVKIENDTVIYSNNHWEIASDVSISSHCHIHAREPGMNGILKMGTGSYIGNHSIVDLTDDIQIGSQVAIGPNCVLYTHDHDYRNSPGIPWKGTLLKSPVIIEDGAWIASGVTILPGVTIGKNAVVAAGSVVTKSVAEGEVVGGIPARPLT